MSDEKLREVMQLLTHWVRMLNDVQSELTALHAQRDALLAAAVRIYTSHEQAVDSLKKIFEDYNPAEEYIDMHNQLRDAIALCRGPEEGVVE